MKKIFLLFIAFVAILLIPQDLMAQDQEKKVTKEVRVEKQKQKRADVVPVRKNTKQAPQVPVNQSQKAVKKEAKKDETEVVLRRKHVVPQKNGEEKEIEMIAKPLKKKTDKKRGKSNIKEPEKQ